MGSVPECRIAQKYHTGWTHSTTLPVFSHPSWHAKEQLNWPVARVLPAAPIMEQSSISPES